MAKFKGPFFRIWNSNLYKFIYAYIYFYIITSMSKLTWEFEQSASGRNQSSKRFLKYTHKCACKYVKIPIFTKTWGERIRIHILILGYLPMYSISHTLCQLLYIFFSLSGRLNWRAEHIGGFCTKSLLITLLVKLAYFLCHQQIGAQIRLLHWSLKELLNFAKRSEKLPSATKEWMHAGWKNIQIKYLK